MKKKTIALLLVLMLVFGISAGGTIAWLTSTPDAVVNTFTVGKVEITLDEAAVTLYGEKEDYNGDDAIDEDDRIAGVREGKTYANSYKLIPGHTYDKDPTVHVQPNSEKCYVFVKVENGITAVETETESETIAYQIKQNWTALGDNYPGVYYKEQNAVAEGDDIVDLVVFEDFTLKDDADVAQYETMPEIKITAYAIQFDGMENEVDAWTKVSAAANS